ncbi:hypothetical protein M3664_04725 [Paenibacillus lautus]|uniref:hypothetical protein n=1 Tax=Paenibacillus lautus TaxID=1401 RepID=UPI00203EB3DB|nr:hypothetical protein [Paenibacillus lautus]MCM3257086.1 hypothetical protein [Paenibacillus lautus]
MKYKKAVNKYFKTRYGYEVIVAIHVKEGDEEDDLIREFTIASDKTLTIDEMLQKAADVIHNTVDTPSDFYRYDIVQITGITILGAYDREIS